MNHRLSALFGAQPRFSEAEFELIFLEHYPRIASAAYQLLGDYDEAEDVAAEAFWKLWQHPPAHGENVPGWLYRVVINLGYNRLRSTRRRAGHENHAYLLDVERSYRPGPEDEVSSREEKERTRKVLGAMAEKDVQILLMHAAGFSYKEIAAAMKISLGSVGVLITRAEHKFERLFVQGEKYAPQS